MFSFRCIVLNLASNHTKKKLEDLVREDYPVLVAGVLTPPKASGTHKETPCTLWSRVRALP